VSAIEDPADDAVLAAAAQLDPRAFTALYERYVRKVYRYCLLRLGSHDAAEDATSEVFLRALAGIGAYRGGIFAAWLFRIAQHTVADVRRRGRTRPSALPIDAAGEVVDPDDLPEERLLAKSDRDSVRTALLELPPDQRAMLELQLAGLSTEEIAAVLGRSANAVRLLRFKGQQRLRAVLAERGEWRAHETGGQPCRG
jgi:RNA polymerase sigma-70 factor (ECF subfamily)